MAPWMTDNRFKQLLRGLGKDKSSDPTRLLGTSAALEPPFLVEVAYLNSWDWENQNQPSTVGIILSAEWTRDHRFSIAVTCNDDTVPKLYLLYDFDKYYLKHGLMILNDVNLVYKRRDDQNPATAWKTNALANDETVTDVNGNMLFVGDPYGKE